MDSPTTPCIAVEIRRRREQAGISQRELARRGGISNRTVSMTELGRVPSISIAETILAVLGCELAVVERGEVEVLRARVAELEARATSVHDLRAQNRRYEEAFAALARQPVLTHDLIDEARAAAAGNRTHERTAA
jgi:transcriptional regulator with XRE-family HTH domain